MKVLFDFEIDENVPHTKDDALYTMVREFFKSKFEPLDKEIERYLQKGEVALVTISMHGDTLKTIPYNIPVHLINKLNQCITPEELHAFQNKIIAMRQNM